MPCLQNSLTTTLYEEADLEPCFLACAANVLAGRCLWEKWVQSSVSSSRQEGSKTIQQGHLVLCRRSSGEDSSLCENSPWSLPSQNASLVCSASSTFYVLAQDGEGRGCLWLSGNPTFISVAKVVPHLNCIVVFSITQSCHRQAAFSCFTVIAVCSLGGKKSVIIYLIGMSAHLCSCDKWRS